MLLLLFVLLMLALAPVAAHAQSPDSLGSEIAGRSLQVSGGVDVYYGYDFSRPSGRDRLHTTQALRHNEFNLNWGFLQTDYSTGRVRATFALHTGTYVQANYATEPNELTRLISQANIGVQLRQGVWLDVGVLPSHIGYESTFSFENELYTRALMAENSPYYETGARLTTELSEQVTLQFLVLNGWQNIAETNDAKSLGFSLSYTPTDQLTLSYNNYYGNEAPAGTNAKRRYFHNIYAGYLLSDRLTVAASADLGRQELWTSSDTGTWYTAMLLMRYHLNKRISLSGRIEHYNDEHQLIVATGTPNGFQTSSATLNLNYAPAPNLLWRAEVRGYHANDPVFTGEKGDKQNNLLLVTSFALKF